MDYTTRIGNRATQAHINYQCPCGCTAGLTYDRTQGAEHLGRCCCGRLLWVGADATQVVRSNFSPQQEYQVDEGDVLLPWGETQRTALAEPLEAIALEKAKREAGKVPVKVVDPVCRMMFDPELAAAQSSFQGTTYYFCAPTCKVRFDANPRQFVKSKGLIERLRWWR